jgi:DNA-binding transcriptional regulator LsrR (DeoR family)
MLYKFDKKEMAIRASILYYEKNNSQSYIANVLGISRSSVSLLLNYARKNGIVKITIDVDTFNLRMLRKEIEFSTRFSKVKQFYIMKSESYDFTQRQIGKFAAPYITEILNKANVIGIGLGKSVREAINSLEAENFIESSNKKIVQIMGGLSNKIEAGTHSNEIVRKLSKIMNCEYYYLNCPAIFEDRNLRKILLKEKNIKTAINMWDSIDLAIMGIGVADRRSSLFKLFTDDMIKIVENSRACGQININFFDSEGNNVPMLENNKICIPIEKMKNIKRKIVIGFGEYKIKAILGALKGGYADFFFTDSITIDALENYIETEKQNLILEKEKRKNKRSIV